jgi:Cu(I)/Ag(I) efflux system membrane fusion protein/cobalt-zinc-cadmium efflux system membrane fusion protein
MNKYIVRTSLFWLFVMAAVGGGAFYRLRVRQRPAPHESVVEPLASGPSSKTDETPTAPQPGIEAPLVPVQLTADQIQTIGVKSGTVEYKQLADDVRATGTVTTDERLVSYVQVRFPGYIRQVFANATYQYVRKGEPLFTIYSPDLVATQREYLLARQNQKTMSSSPVDGVATGAASLSEAAEQRLQQWEVPASEMAKLKETGKAISDITINSPVSGYITERTALPNMSVDSSSHLYTIADLSRVWVNAQVFQNDVGRVRPGDSAAITVDAYPDHTFSARIEAILPQVDMTTRTVAVRLAVSNAGLKLKPGMFVNVDLKSGLGRQLVVPVSAVFQTGIRQVVFLDHGNGSLEPRDVVLGPQEGDSYVVLKGLEVHQQIVTSASFLLDSESQLQAAAGPASAQPSTGMVMTSISPSNNSNVGLDFKIAPDPPHRGPNDLHVTLATSGHPTDGADVSVTFSMPAMPAMGMAAVNKTFPLAAKGGGQYEGQGSLESGGIYNVTIVAKHHGQSIATKRLRVTAQGGM